VKTDIHASAMSLKSGKSPSFLEAGVFLILALDELAQGATMVFATVYGFFRSPPQDIVLQLLTRPFKSQPWIGHTGLGDPSEDEFDDANSCPKGEA
jgi:hypothetical protein